VAVYKRGKVWWYKFNWKGQSIRKSTKQNNKRAALQIEAARKTELAKGEAGLEDRKQVPTLEEFSSRFEEYITIRCADKPATVSFYKSKIARLLTSELKKTRLSSIDEASIDIYTQVRRKQQSRRKSMLSAASVNRELATLRRVLRLAHDWKLIQRVPRIRLLRGEKPREFVLSPQTELIDLASCPDQLRDVSILLLDTGLRMGEALKLRWEDIVLVPAHGAAYGYLTVRAGNAKNSKCRNVPLSARVRTLLFGFQPKESGLVLQRANGRSLSQNLAERTASSCPRDIKTTARIRSPFPPAYFRHTVGRIRS
jgi:integrase